MAGGTPLSIRPVGILNWYNGSPAAEHAGSFATPTPTSWEPFQPII